jgi:DnaB-like helicase N terminal domain/AAA domain
MTSPVPFRRGASLPVDLAKKLPANEQVERELLGAILVFSNTPNAPLAEARKVLDPGDFSSEPHRRIFRNMLFLADTSMPIDTTMLADNLEKNRELDAAGGIAYLASLLTGIPRINNVAAYANIIKEKARLRELIHLTHELQTQAFEGRDGENETGTSIVRNAIDRLNALAKPRGQENPLVTVSYKELLTLELPKAEPLVDPLVTRAGTFMLFSWAGWGKSWIATELAFRVAKGVDTIFNGHSGAGGHWPIFGPVKTLYLYGEMHGERIRQRLQMIARAHDTPAEFDNLMVASKDYQRIARAPAAAHSWRPSIATASDRRHVEERIFGEGAGFLVLDNISTLWSAAQEDQSNQVAILKDWFIDLNTRGITVFFLQHAGKGGDFLGDSAQVHILDSYVQLEHAPDYKAAQGLRVNLHIKKLREFGNPAWSVPFEAQLQIVDGSAQWLTRPARAAQKKAAYELYVRGVPVTEALKEFQGGLPRPTLYRWYQEFKERHSAEPTADDDE